MKTGVTLQAFIPLDKHGRPHDQFRDKYIVLLGPVVRKQVNANPGLKLTKVPISLVEKNFQGQV